MAHAQNKIKRMLSVKIHKTGGDTLVAACDANILGETFSDGDLELHLSENFYGGQQLQEQDFINLLADATLANIMGEKAVNAAVTAGHIEESSVIEVAGIKHAQIFNL